jgi:hypothetical protein
VNNLSSSLTTLSALVVLVIRSTPHSTTGVSPAELLFGRKLRTKLPDINLDYLDDIEIRDRDSERKEKGKLYSDKRRNAKTNDLKSGDQVLVKVHESV